MRSLENVFIIFQTKSIHFYTLSQSNETIATIAMLLQILDNSKLERDIKLRTCWSQYRNFEQILIFKIFEEFFLLREIWDLFISLQFQINEYVHFLNKVTEAFEFQKSFDSNIIHNIPKRHRLLLILKKSQYLRYAEGVEAKLTSICFPRLSRHKKKYITCLPVCTGCLVQAVNYCAQF